MFFFEKKNQKTIVVLGLVRSEAPAQITKSFFSKKAVLPFSPLTPPADQ
jgi:hypothetical protein